MLCVFKQISTEGVGVIKNSYVNNVRDEARPNSRWIPEMMMCEKSKKGKLRKEGRGLGRGHMGCGVVMTEGKLHL